MASRVDNRLSLAAALRAASWRLALAIRVENDIVCLLVKRGPRYAAESARVCAGLGAVDPPPPRHQCAEASRGGYVHLIPM
jgi:hypothetical protein